MYQFENPNINGASPVVPISNTLSQTGTPILDVAEIVGLLWRRKALVFLCALIAVMLAIAVLTVVPRKYTASTRILIPPAGLNVTEKEVTPRAQSDGANVTQVESQMRVMVSDQVLRQVVVSEGLADDEEFGRRVAGPLDLPRALLSFLKGPSKTSSEPREARALRLFRKSVEAKRVKNSYVVDLHVTSLDASKSSRLANAIAQTYVASEVTVNAGTARRVSGALSARAEELNRGLHEAEKKVERYKIENNIVDVGVGKDGRLLSEDRLTQMTEQLSLAQARVSQASAKAAQIERLKTEGLDTGVLPEAIQSEAIAQLRNRFANAHQTVAVLEQALGERHPRLAAARAQVADVQRSINAELTRIGSSIRGELERGKSDVADLTRKLRSLERSTQNTKQSLVGLRNLERDVNASRIVYEAFLVRARETGEQHGLDTSGARVISEAVSPISHAGPRTLLVLLFAGFVGAGLGSVGVIARERFGKPKQSVDGIGQLTGYPVLSVIPGDELTDDAQAQPLSKGAGLLSTSGLPAVVLHRPDSATSLAFRRLDQFLRSLGSTGSGRLVVVTSPMDGHGKSTVALNLALAANEAGARVLLVDGDNVGQCLSIASGSPTANPAQAGSGTGNLIVTPVFTGLENNLKFASVASLSSALVGGDTIAPLSRLLPGLARDYDILVVDACTLSSGQDLAGLLAVSSDVIAVIRRDKSTAGQLEQTMTPLRPVSSRVRGTVIIDDV